MHQIQSLLLLGLGAVQSTLAQDASDLVGTWTTKSKQVLTGPGFYNPVSDRLVEPSLTGISYSFTADGHYEEAYYRAVSNPTSPDCPQGIMQWQHGTFTVNSTGALLLTPISVDGRQLLSTPCQYENSLYTRYDQAEVFQRYSVYTDPYHNVKRLDMFQFDGSPMNPMFLAYSPPQMLPTSTLNPTPTASASSKSRVKRELDSTGEEPEPMNKHAILHPKDPYNPDMVWWAGVTFTAIGGLVYMYS